MRQARKCSTKMAFQKFYPREFKVNKVSWVRCRTEPHCIWRVEYNLKNLTLLSGEGNELKKHFNVSEKYHKPNSPIINVQRSSNAIIDYGVVCKCGTPNFEVAVQSPCSIHWTHCIKTWQISR